MKQGLSDVLLFLWFLSLCLVLSIFQQSYPISTYGRGWCAAPLWLFLTFGLEYFQQSYPISTYKAGLSDVLLFVIPFFVFGLRYFSTVLPNSYLWSRDWVMCCSFVIPFFVFGLKSIFQQSYNFYLWKQGLSDVLLFVIPLCLVLRVFFNSPTISTYEAGIEWCAALLWFLSFVFGLRVYFQQSYPISTYESRIEWCAALLWFLSLRLVLSIFNSPTISTYKAGIDVLLFCDSFLYVWS
jgi:hypothetical protein